MESILRTHPRIKCAKTKEVGFFNRDKFYQLGLDWYARQFPYRFSPNVLLFEGTPEYLYYPFVTERILRFDPHLKLIVLLRDPVERAFSAWNMFRHFHSDPRIKNDIIRKFLEDANPDVKQPLIGLLSTSTFPDFHDCVQEEINAFNTTRECLEPSFVKRGLYADQIERFHRQFSKEKMLILESKELKNDRRGTVNQVLQFLQVPERNGTLDDVEDKNVRPYTSQICAQTRKLLQDFFRPHNARLYALLGRHFAWD